MKVALRTKTIGARVTGEEYARLDALAESQNQKLSEWARAVLLRESSCAATATMSEQTTLAEVLALRTILLNLLFSLAKGEPVTAEQMQALIERADAGKTAKAENLLSAAKGVRTPATEKGKGEQ
jgi:hypothetical protein